MKTLRRKSGTSDLHCMSLAVMRCVDSHGIAVQIACPNRSRDQHSEVSLICIGQRRFRKAFWTTKRYFQRRLTWNLRLGGTIRVEQNVLPSFQWRIRALWSYCVNLTVRHPNQLLSAPMWLAFIKGDSIPGLIEILFSRKPTIAMNSEIMQPSAMSDVNSDGPTIEMSWAGQSTSMDL